MMLKYFFDYLYWFQIFKDQWGSVPFLSKLRLIRLYLLFIDEASTCSDKKIAPYPNGEKFNDLWHTTPIYESNEACKNKKEGTALIR